MVVERSRLPPEMVPSQELLWEVLPVVSPLPAVDLAAWVAVLPSQLRVQAREILSWKLRFRN